jgi:hypothetical protein
VGTAVLAGCGAHAAYDKRDLPTFVLSQSDLGAKFTKFGDSEQARIDAHAGPRHDPARFGRIEGWVSRYRHAGASIETPGPLVVESRADLFKSPGGAKKDLQAYIVEYDAIPATPEDAPKLGDETLAFRFGSGKDLYHLVAWRDSNATASVLVEGSAVTAADAERLARLQQAHLAAAR